MRARRAAALSLSIALAASACAQSPLPADRHVTAEQAITSGKGAYAAVELLNGGQVWGELIAVSGGPAGALSILTQTGTLETVPLSWVHHVRLGVHETHEDAYALWVVLGSVSTLSHGLFLIISLPTWLIAGSVATAAESHRGLLDCNGTDPAAPEPPPPRSGDGDRGGARAPVAEPCSTALVAYARFPQGLPAGVRAEHLLGRAKWPPPAAPPVSPTTSVPYDAPPP